MTNREFKFRVWDKLLHKWGNPKDFLFIDGGGNLRLGDVADCSVIQQYTGLKDSKGKEIYEGDIVSCSFLEHPIRRVTGEVRYNNCGFKIFVAGKYFCDLDVTNVSKWVIGNIFENKELL